MSRMLLDAGVDAKRLEDVVYLTVKEIDLVADIQNINYEKKPKKRKKLKQNIHQKQTAVPLQVSSKVSS